MSESNLSKSNIRISLLNLPPFSRVKNKLEISLLSDNYSIDNENENAGQEESRDIVLYKHNVFILDMILIKPHIISTMSEKSYVQEIYKLVGASIAKARKSRKKRVTQLQMSARTNGELSRSAIANIESGRQRLGVHQLYLIARALECETYELLPPLKNIFEGDFLTSKDELARDPKLRGWLSKVIARPLTDDDIEGK